MFRDVDSHGDYVWEHDRHAEFDGKRFGNGPNPLAGSEWLQDMTRDVRCQVLKINDAS